MMAEPRKRVRKARPAENEATTVTSMAATPRAIERSNEPAKSPTICFSNRLPNQCTDTPCIGKVSPPVGPWNDSTRMVSVGP